MTSSISLTPRVSKLSNHWNPGLVAVAKGMLIGDTVPCQVVREQSTVNLI